MCSTVLRMQSNTEMAATELEMKSSNDTINAVVVYHSGYGHTKRVAEAVAEGAGATLLAIDADGVLPEPGWGALDAADAIIFGSPTYMGGPSWQFKKFADETSVLVKFENAGGLRRIRSKAHHGCMDANTLAFKIVQQSIGEEPIKKKQPNSANRGRARAAALTPESRKSIAQKAAAARWQGRKDVPRSPA